MADTETFVTGDTVYLKDEHKEEFDMTEWYVQLPMFAEDRWPEGIYRDEEDARRVASVGDRQLFMRTGKDEEWTEIEL